MSARVSWIRRYLKTQIAAARDAIYKLGAPIKGTEPERNLKQFSLVPTLVCSFYFILCKSSSQIYENSFVERLGHLGFSIFPALVVDLLHEFELGVFKAVFKHLLRILHAIDSDALMILNKRYAVFHVIGLYIFSYVYDEDSIRFHPSERVPSGGSLLMSLTSSNVLHATLKMSFR